MAELTAKIPISKVTKEVTMQVRVTGFRSFKFRLWIATLLIRLAAFVAGMGIEVNLEELSDGKKRNNRS
jgi:hypothetical protein